MRGRYAHVPKRGAARLIQRHGVEDGGVADVLRGLVVARVGRVDRLERLHQGGRQALVRIARNVGKLLLQLARRGRVEERLVVVVLAILAHADALLPPAHRRQSVWV